MKPITGTAAITEAPDIVAPAAPPHTYLGVAGSLLSGVRVLAAATPPPALPLAMLSAHVLECILKAYLSRNGDDSHVKHPDVRHNLNALWSLAASQGLSIPPAPPAWVACLSHLHDSPYYLRYSKGVHGVVSPAAEPMATELAALLEQVRKQV